MQKSKVLSIAAALIVALALWIYVVAVVNPEDTVEIRDIPVTFTGEELLQEDHGLMISEGENATISLKLYGKRSELNRLNASNITVMVDVSKVRTPKTYSSYYEVTFPANVNASEINIQERNPGTLHYTVERLATKPVDVVGVFNGKPAEGYEVGTMTFDRSTIDVSGSEEIINRLSAARVELERDNLSETVVATLPVKLIDHDGNEISADDVHMEISTVEVTLPISKMKQINLVVGLIDGGGATEKNAIVTIDPPSVLLSGDAAVIDNLHQINLGNLDLATVIDTMSTELRILIPNQVKNVSGEETAIVTVQLKGLATKKLRAGSIDFVNLPDDLEPQSLTSQYMVTLRGPEEQVEQVTANSVRVVADLTGYNKSGTYEVPVTVYVDGYKDVGALNVKPISVSLTEEGSADPSSEGNPDDPNSAEYG